VITSSSYLRSLVFLCSSNYTRISWGEASSRKQYVELYLEFRIW